MSARNLDYMWMLYAPTYRQVLDMACYYYYYYCMHSNVTTKHTALHDSCDMHAVVPCLLALRLWNILSGKSLCGHGITITQCTLVHLNKYVSISQIKAQLYKQLQSSFKLWWLFSQDVHALQFYIFINNLVVTMYD